MKVSGESLQVLVNVNEIVPPKRQVQLVVAHGDVRVVVLGELLRRRLQEPQQVGVQVARRFRLLVRVVSPGEVQHSPVHNRYIILTWVVAGLYSTLVRIYAS